MPSKSVSQLLSKDLPIAFTDKPITGFGGLAIFARFCRQLGLMERLREAVPDEKQSNNSIRSVEIVLAFLMGVLRGARRFSHVAWLRHDVPLQKIFGFSRPPSASSVTRFFGTFRRIHVEHLWANLSAFVLQRVEAPRWGHTLDLDSTVFVRYGNQEGSRKGYNPKKRGRPSHHPLMAFLAEAKMVLHVWLRSGNTGSARGVVPFLKEALALLPHGHRLYAVRADSGFCQNAFFAFLEEQNLPYAVAARFTAKVQRIVVSQVAHWHPFGPGLEVAETTYQALGWPLERRLVLIRETIQERKAARGRKLLDCPGYTFHALVTSLDWPAETVWRFYNSRADSENRIKEIAEHYGAKGFCVHRFDGTEAALRLVCFLFNLITLFKEEILHNRQPMLERLRSQLFAVGAALGWEGGKPILRIGAKGPLRQRFQLFLTRIKQGPPTASQLTPDLGLS
jgi:hypothetical protein